MKLRTEKQKEWNWDSRNRKKSIKPKTGSLTTAKPLAKQPKCKRQKAQITHLSRYRRHKSGMKAGISLQIFQALKAKKAVILWVTLNTHIWQFIWNEQIIQKP